MDTRTVIRGASALALLSLGASPAFAHQGEVRRSLMLETAKGPALEILVHVAVRGEDRRRALILLADGDRDGKIGAPEREVLGAQLLARGLDGLRLATGTATVAWPRFETKLDLAASGPVELMARTRIPFSADRLTVSVGRDALPGDPLDLLLLPGVKPPHTRRGRVGKAGVVEIKMAPVDRVVVRY